MRVFADTNIAVYAESDDGEKSKRARAIIESSPVISTQVVNELIAALTGKYTFSKADAYEVAKGLMDLCEVAPMPLDHYRFAISSISALVRLTKPAGSSSWPPSASNA